MPIEKRKGVGRGEGNSTEKHVAVAIRKRVAQDILYDQVLKVVKCLCSVSYRSVFNRTRFQSPCAVVNLSDLSQISGDIVSIESLKEAGLIRSIQAAKLLAMVLLIKHIK